MALPCVATEPVTLSIVIPCFNEERTLGACLERVMALRRPDVRLDVIVVDDCSRDGSHEIACRAAARYPEIIVLRHERNGGKGAAVRTGFRKASGHFVAVQDADLEYDPQELLSLLGPLRDGRADVVFGSRFKGQGPHLVLYFWHYVGNAILTLLSNMFTDLNVTDMETCYKVFRREVLETLDLREDGFGFEPEIVAKLAHRGLRIYEMPISYQGRTYEEGKKIGWRDGLRALYCVFRYNADFLPTPMQFLIYLLIGGLSALLNLASFVALFHLGVRLPVATLAAFGAAAAANYGLCILLLFRHRARWSSPVEIGAYLAVVVLGAGLDLGLTTLLYAAGLPAWTAKAAASALGLVYNFVGRRYLVF